VQEKGVPGASGLPGTPAVSAVIVAAGSGSRYGNGNSTPKQFQTLGEYPLYIWSVKTFAQHPMVAEVLVVASETMVSRVNAEIQKYVPGSGIRVTEGGATRQESVHKALLYLDKNVDQSPEFVVIHDAARPFVSPSLITNVLRGAIEYGASTAVIPVSDTVKRVEGDFVRDTLPREDLVLVQTPQSARFDWLLRAHAEAVDKQVAVTDDAAIIEFAQHPVSVVPGSAMNIKITLKEDFELARAIAQISRL
jgi:2-C-methyl-D-erythritol 4-phosphate cytidylyltransferase